MRQDRKEREGRKDEKARKGKGIKGQLKIVSDLAFIVC